MTLVSPTEEDLFITLASNHIRRVASPEGAQYYGLPIGAPITADLVAKIKAEKGGVAPKGGLKSSASGNKGENAPSVKTGGGSENSSFSPAAVGMTLQVHESTISGPSKFKVGAGEFTAPGGSKLVRPKDNPDMAYVLTPDGKVHAFNKDGEVDVPETLASALASKFANDLTDDPNYEELPLGDTSGNTNAASLKAGDTLHDLEGNVQFVKQADGTFKHTALGAKVDAADVQPMIDNGDLQAKENPALDDFKSMSHNEAEAALNAAQPGEHFHVGNEDPEMVGNAHIVKNEDGTFSATQNDGTGTGSSLTATQLAFTKTHLYHHSSDDHTDPDAAEQDAQQQIAQDAAAKQAEADGKPAPVPAADKGGNEPPKSTGAAATPTEDEQDGPKLGEPYIPENDAHFPAGTVFHHNTHVEKGTADESNGLTKQNNGYFTKANGQPYNYKVTSKFQVTSVPDSSNEDEQPQQDAPDAPDASTSESAPESVETPTDAPAGSSDKNTSTQSATVADVKQTTEAPETPAEPEAKKPEDLVEGDSPVPAFAEYAATGAVVNSGNLEWKKDSDGTWISSNGFPYDNDQMADFFNQPSFPLSVKSLGAEPEPETTALTPGQTVTMQDLKDAVPGTVIVWDAAGLTDEYTKLPTGDFLTPSGLSIGLGNFEKAIDAGYMKFKSAPTPEVQDEDSNDLLHGYSTGDKITKMGHVNSFPEGTQLVSVAGAEGDISKGVLSTKTAEGWKAQHNETGASFGMSTPDELAHDLEQGYLYFKSGPDNSHVHEDAAESLNDAENFHVSTTPDTMIGDTAFSTKDMKDALDALEAHSGFQVKYGLNGAPEGNPFKDADTRALLTAEAQKAYPDLKPKPAVVAYLKSKLGIQEEKHEEESHVATGPMIQIGSASPQTTQTGFDGGEFAYSDIEDAIKILEGSNSKLYKNELNKQGNPLGALSPNHISGFEKDKLVGKQKFIDYLKDALSKHEPSSEEHVITPEPVDEVEALTSEIEEAMDDLDTTTPDGNTYVKGQDAFNLPKGTKGVNTLGVHVTKTSEAGETGDADSWFSDEGEEYTFSAQTTGVHVLSLPQEPDIEPVEDGWEWPDADVKWGLSDTQDAPIGTTVQFAEGSGIYKKTGEDEWSSAFSSAVKLQNQSLAGYKFNKYEGDLPINMEDAGTSLSTPAQFEIGSNVHDVVEELPSASKIKSMSGAELVKDADGQWVMTNSGVSYTSEQLKVATTELTLMSLPTEKQGKDEPITSTDLDYLPVGTVIEAHYQSFASDFYTKTGDGTWKDEYDQEFGQDVVTNHMDQGGKYTLKSKPQGEPEYAHTPEAVQENQPHGEFDLPKDEDVTDAEIGSVFKDTSDGNVEYWTKVEDKTWIGVNNEGEAVSQSNESNVIKRANAGELAWPNEQGPDYNKSGLMPGKYLGSGKAYMVVKADGKGVYVNSKGKVIALSANAVKKNHAAGMNLYNGMPDTIPSVGDALGDTEKSPTAKKAAPLGDLTLPDGIYYSTHPDLDHKATVYEVNGDNVTVFKPATSVEGSNAKVNGYADKAWTQNSTNGAKVNFVLWNVKHPELPHGGTYEFTKTNGVWVDQFGGVAPHSAINDVTYGTWQDYFNSKPGYDWYNTVVLFHGQKEPLKVTQKKIQTQIKKGQITDQNGMSIVPDGYSGDVKWFGNSASVLSLVKAQQAMGGKDDSTSIVNALKSSGVPSPALPIVKKYTEAQGIEWTDDNKWKAVKKSIDELLVGLDTTIPEADTSKYFDYDEFGAVTPPASMNDPVTTYNSASLSNYIKAQGAAFGGGGIIGQHYGQMDKWEKQAWINAYKAGDFAEMYSLEQSAAASKGKVHASGYLHPGFADNTETHNVAWGAAVKGEVSALTEVPGEWSSSSLKAPMAEIDNYLIKAQMQNPTHLTEVEKRYWVAYHRASTKSKVDDLSITAQSRKMNGDSPLTPEVQWTDDIKPSKSYDYLFDSTKFPTQWTEDEAKDWAKDLLAGLPDVYPDLSNKSATQKEQFFADQPAGTQFWVGVYSPYVKDEDGDGWSDSDGDPVSNYDMAMKAGSYSVINMNPEGLDPKSEQAEFLETFKNNSSGYSAFPVAVGKHFQAKKDIEDAKALIPVYSIAPDQTVQKGTQQIYDVTDQFGNKYFFKPRPKTQMDDYRTEAEHAGNVMGRLMGFDTAQSKIVEIDGQRGQLQKDVGGVGNLLNADYGTLTASQLADIASEHVLDWFIDNDDAKGDNVKVMASGHVVGIDKGRAWKHFGAWNGLSGDHNMNSNANTIYSQMFDAMRNGQISKEDADFAYLAMQKKIKKMQKVSDAKVSEVLADGMKSRPSFEVSYQIDGKAVPQNLSGLTAAMLDRKSHLDEDFENLWKGIYSDAGYGDLPEPPANELGEIINGLEDSNLHAEVFKAKITGKAAMVSGGHVIGGNVLTWMDEYQDGSQNLSGQFYLAPKAQEKMLDFLVQNATDVKPENSSTLGFSQYDTYGDKFLQAAKTINHHSEDGQYNMDKVNPFTQAVKDIDTELSEWSPTLQSNAKSGGEDAFKFSTGKVVPMTHVDQYKLMLDAYKEKAVPIQAGYDKKTKTGTFTPFDAVSINPSKPKYVSDEGSVLQPLSKGYLHKNANTGAVKMVTDAEAKEHAEQSDIWKAVDETNTEKIGGGIKITKRNYTHEKKATFKDFKKITKKEHDGNAVNGSSGQEYEIELPTGEKIYYRNGGNTGTALGQQGRVTFRADDTNDEAAVSAALSNVMAQLGAMGFNLDASNHTDAELTYWREMYGILANRNHTMSGASGKAYAAAEKDMWDKQKEIGGKKEHFLEEMSEKMSPDEQVTFWRDLWAKHFGQEKVDDLIANEGYLPKYDHQDYTQPDLETGAPYWERLDFTDEELESTGKLLMATTGSGASVWEDRFKSGGLLSGEERLRQLDNFVSGGYGSAGQDQNNGSSHYIYTRVMGPESAEDGYDVIFSPALMRRTRSYSFNGDNYGKLANRKKGAPSDSKYVLNNFDSGGNETMLPNTTTLMDGLEIMIFDSTSARDKAIQDLKKAGIEEIRGLPVEDRLVMRSKVQEAIKKVKDAWSKKYE